MAVLHEVYRYNEDVKKTHVNRQLKQELNPSSGHGSSISWIRGSSVIPVHVRGSHEPAHASGDFIPGRRRVHETLAL